MFDSPLESETKASRGRSILILGVTAAVLVAIIAGALYVNHQRRAEAQVEAEPLRAGAPGFDSYQKFVELEPQDPQGSENLLGQVLVVAKAILHNRGDRTLSHVEVHAVVYDGAGNEIGNRKAQPVPKVRSQLGPGESMLVQVSVDNVPAGADPSAATVKLSGLQFKE